MSKSLDPAAISIFRPQASAAAVLQNHDNCDIWDNTGHDGGPSAGGDDFNGTNCG